MVQFSVSARLASLRNLMKSQGIDGLLIPYNDAYLSRNAPAPASDRLFWATGFDGSAGTAIILAERAALIVDPRYTLKARDCTDPALFEVVEDTGDMPPEAWAKSAMTKGQILAYDPRLHTASDVRRMDAVLKPAGITLKPQRSLVDTAWGQPDVPVRQAVLHTLQYAGRSTADKIKDVCAVMRAADIDVTVITRADSLSWLINARVPTLAVVPVVHGYGVLDATAQRLDVYTDVVFDHDVFDPAWGGHVHVHPEAEIDAALKAIATQKRNIGMDDTAAPYMFRQTLEALGATVAAFADPCNWPKARKNDVEQQGIRASHVRDGVALVRLFHWLDTHVASGTITELDIVQQALHFRAQGQNFTGHSFETIAGFNASGASIHSMLNASNNQTIKGDGLLLVDSGGQYVDGTTDVTRTWAIGIPTIEMRRCATRVMKGHIALASAVFLEGTTGFQLDTLARAPLWAEGMDYGHGTGHGVGYYLNVHEGPCNFAPKLARAADALQTGLLMSIEPGYYREGAFGIRLENLVLVVQHAGQNYTGRNLLCFEPVTLVPFDTRAFEPSLFSATERAWLNAYHARVLATLGPLVPADVAGWLNQRCQPL